MSDHFVAILMGSDSDLEIMRSTIEVLEKLCVRCEVRILSAHRTPVQTIAYVEDADKRGCKVFIAAAGLAAHLAGAVAANTIKPVIGVPLAASMHGLDALLSTVQMPGGVPVASMAIGKPGAKNAGYFAAAIVALFDPAVAQHLAEARDQQTKNVLEKNAELQLSLAD